MRFSKKDRPYEINEMIDLHSHILPGLDDGSRNVEESIRMCQVSYRDGVRTIVATPHTLTEPYQNDRTVVLSKVRELNDMVRKFGAKRPEFVAHPSMRLLFELSSLSFDPKIDPMTQLPNDSMTQLPNDPITQLSSDSMTDFRILPGSDVRLCAEILLCFDQGKVTTVGDNKRFMIVEFPFYSIPYQAEDILFGLMARGITPIISHPERNVEIEQRPGRYYEMIRVGCLGQVTAMSLTGGFGSHIRRFAEKLLKKRLIHAIASDAHGINGRPPGLTAAVREAEKIIGREEAIKLVTEYPRAIIDGHMPNVPEPLSI
jgi:protein-tyrosine phosphatase